MNARACAARRHTPTTPAVMVESVAGLRGSPTTPPARQWCERDAFDDRAACFWFARTHDEQSILLGPRRPEGRDSSASIDISFGRCYRFVIAMQIAAVLVTVR